MLNVIKKHDYATSLCNWEIETEKSVSCYKFKYRSLIVTKIKHQESMHGNVIVEIKTP